MDRWFLPEPETQVTDTFSPVRSHWLRAQPGGLHLWMQRRAGTFKRDVLGRFSRWVKMLVILADLVLALFVLAFVVQMIRNRKQAAGYLKNTALFLTFIALCIGASSVTVRVEMRWIYVSYTAALLFLCYISGVLRQPAGKWEKRENSNQRLFRRGVYAGGFLLYLALMFPVECFYRQQYPKLYFWPNQLRYNSLAEETYEKYGDEIFGKTIYIVGNSYEMSDFTARTFFKVFDKERKAEGTTVQFVDSILEIGQVTDQMLILTEDPAHNGFQDITEMIQLKMPADRGVLQRRLDG